MADTFARIVLSAVDKTAQAFASANASLKGLEKQAGQLSGVFGLLIPTASLAGVTAYFKSINDGVDALNDLKDATGGSIENISALEDVAARTGTSFDTVGTALVKFNQLLNDAEPGSEAEKSLAAIGLKAQELRKLDPAEALRQYAVALSGFADDGKKARLVQDQLGKSLREVSPLLNDLATQGQLVATVTTQQAEEAEKLNKQLFELQKNAKDAGRSLTADLVQGLNAAAKAYKDGGFFDGIKTLIGGSDEFQANRQLADGVEKLLYLEKALAAARAEGYKDGSRVVENLKAQKDQVEENIRLAQNYLKVLRGEDQPAKNVEAKVSVQFDKEAAKKATEDAKKFQEEIKRLLAQDRSGLISGVEARLKEDEEIAALERKQIEELNALREDARQRELKQVFEFIDEQETAEIESAQAVIRASEEGLKKSRDLARDLGFTFSSAFEDAVIGGEKLSKVIQGIGQDILRIALRKMVTEPLAGAAVSGLGKLLSGLSFGGGSGGNIPIDGYAGGGYTGSGSRSGGLDGQGGFLAMLHPQETVIDHTRGMPLVEAGGGGQQINYSPVFNIGDNVSARQVREVAERVSRNAVAGLVDQLSRAGKI